MNVIIKFEERDLALLKTFLLAGGELTLNEIDECIKETTKEDITLDFDNFGKDEMRVKLTVLALAINQTQKKK